MRVLITGGTGFIGSRLALKCLERGDEVTLLGLLKRPVEEEAGSLLQKQGARLVVASVTDRERVSESLQDVDLVYHLAAAQHEANVPDRHFWEVNVTGTKNMLEAALQAGVKRFVHGSTIGVYGSGTREALDERSPARPENVYGVTKLEGEKLALSFARRLSLVVVRISETYGPGDQRLLKLFKGIKRRLFVMIGSGENLHHPIYIDDLISGLFSASASEKAPGDVFLMAGRQPLTTREMIQIIARQLDSKIPRFRLPLAPLTAAAATCEAICRPLGIQPPIHPRRLDFFKKSFVFSLRRSQEILGFAPCVGFEEGVARTARWYTEMGYL